MQIKNDLVGLSPFWLIGLALVLTFLLAIGVPLIAGPIDSKTWLTFGGSLISGACAIIAVVVATRNVNRQLRINLISREEERIERQLPRLRELQLFFSTLQSLAASGHPDTVLSQIEREYGLGPGIRTADKLVPLLPLSDQQDRNLAIYHVDRLRITCSRLISASQNKRAEAGSLEKLFEYLCHAIARDETAVGSKIFAYEGRLSVFRRELEAHFAD